MTAAERRRLSEQIRHAIVTSELTRYEIAKRSGVDEASLSRFVNERASLSLGSVEKLASVLGLEIVARRSK